MLARILRSKRVTEIVTNRKLNIAEKARLLLEAGVSAKLNANLAPSVFQAQVDDAWLPAYGDTENEAIINGKALLQKRVISNSYL